LTSRGTEQIEAEGAADEEEAEEERERKLGRLLQTNEENQIKTLPELRMLLPSSRGRRWPGEEPKTRG
jgi:hypothetical protein